MKSSPHPTDITAEAPLGTVVGGSLSRGLDVRLASRHSVEQARAGTFVVIHGAGARFFGLISDIELGTLHPDIALMPPEPGSRLARDVMAAVSTFGTVRVRPMLMETGSSELKPVRSIPPHFSQVTEASSDDVRAIFGDEREDHRFFEIGRPLDMDAPVCLDLSRWVERSNAIFGKSGTGKTFLTRLALCGSIRANAAVHLIFDMHSEYGWEGGTEDANRASVRGLKQYFGSRIQVLTLDPEASRRRGAKVDGQVSIPYSAVTPEDVMLLERELNLGATVAETAYVLQRAAGVNWLARLLEMDAAGMKAFCDQYNAHVQALAAMQRKLRRLVGECNGFLRDSTSDGEDGSERILASIRNGTHVVLEFGRYSRVSQYMLVANILTRRIHEAYVEATEEALGAGRARPQPLVIAVEEAHKFLSHGLAEQTVFSAIAREMRKYNVTLLIVDQRPAGIDPEILSQVGTRICCLLDSEHDVDAALSGASGATELKRILAGLESRQQALIFGHAVPMPVVVRTRTYDDGPFRLAMGPAGCQDDDPVEQRRRFQADRDKDFG